MKVKVCGMKHPENIKALAESDIDYMGFIFYEKSPRFAETPVRLPARIQKVGVFVNEDIAVIVEKVNQFGLQVIQLHGDETPDFCLELRTALDHAGQAEVSLWKVFSIKSASDFKGVEAYCSAVDGYLLDTKGQYRGGTGEKFDWQLLEPQNFSRPVMLSGGIGPEDAEQVSQLYKDGLIAGVDVNSGFEEEPGLKNINLIHEFLQNLRTNE
ncbi:phosphoribosylanthranilate isomerase [Psychroflexus sp. YR1-1]|uniref:N-(5'-phosphoribosyl)anthranilate isomerase n=1 Tax=Psychroflexus aurantiacus TaxID=2709310 RepID=A0A6B3R4A4_9FLAO|nr:phosphoribosylanthranilate isomerase [Psychroflexus aurantiacus]NEV94858.1 phosphoribosylanthranilate isomerase [Psychroflexus aurantiacus]